MCLHIDTLFKNQLMKVLAPYFKETYEWALRIEFQGRGTEHLADSLPSLARRVVKVEDSPGTLPSLPMTRSTASEYYSKFVCEELCGRVSPARFC